MSKISQTQKTLNPCEISLPEAKASLAFFKSQLTAEGTTPGFLALAIHELEAIVAGYGEGTVKYTPPVDASELGRLSLKDAINASTRLPFEPAHDGQALAEAETEAVAAKPEKPSRMDFAALLKEEPFGKMSEPCFDLFISDALLLPTPLGYREAVSLDPAVQPQNNWKKLPASTEGADLEIEIDRRSSPIIPVPLGAEVCSYEGKESISGLGRFDPAVWRLEKPRQLLRYALSRTHTAQLLEANELATLRPSEKEVALLQKLLPLPPALTMELEKQREYGNIGSIVSLLSSYLFAKDEKTGYTAARYVCNDDFGDFIQHHCKLLPVIMTELKVGHCALLSWYCAALLRSQGVAAWSTVDVCPTSDGLAFNGSCGHQRVLFIDENNRTRVFDPSAAADVDPSYHPKVLTEDRVCDLDDALTEAKTLPEKVAILRRFRDEQQALMGEAEKDEEVTGDLHQMQSNSPLAIVLAAAGSFDSSYRFTECTASIAGSTLELTPNQIYDEIKYLDEHRSTTVLDIVELTSPVLRRRVKMLYDAVAKTSLSISPDDTAATLQPQLFTGGQMQLERVKAEGLWRLLPRECPTILDCLPGKFQTAESHLKSIPEITTQLAAAAAAANGYSTIFHTQIHALNLLRLPLPARNSLPPYTAAFAKLIRAGELDGELEDREIKTSGTTYPVKLFGGKKGAIDMMVRFTREFQEACCDPSFRARFTKQFKLSPLDFRNLVQRIAGLDDSRVRRRTSFQPPPDRPMTGLTFTVTEKSRAQLREHFTKVIESMHLSPARGREITFNGTRRYAPGDDPRRIDWRYYARSGQLESRVKPEQQPGFSYRLHVIIDVSCPYSEQQGIELIRLLQTKNEIETTVGLMGLYERPAYLTLDHRLRHAPPEEILLSLLSRVGTQDHVNDGAGLRMANGKVPKNLLVISQSISRLLAVKFLYGEGRTNSRIATIWSRDPRFLPFLMARQSWVERGLPRRKYGPESKVVAPKATTADRLD